MDRLIKLFFGAWLFSFSVAPAAAQVAPNIILVGPTRLVRTADQVVVEVQLDSANQQVNAAELHISFPPDRLQVIRVGREQSIWTVWAEEPSWDNHAGTVKLIGGRPKGIIASRATVATIYFSVRHSGLAEVNLMAPSSKVFLHDGRGTPVILPSASLAVTAVDPLAGGLVLRSATHPTLDTWARGGSIDVNWEIESGAIYSYVLSQDRSAQPDDNPDQLVVRATYSGQSDGIYYFSIKSRVSGQDWSEVIQRRFLLDQTPPEPFVIDKIVATDLPSAGLLSWLAIDRTAGVDNYRLLVGGKDQGLVTSPLAMKPTWAGEKISIIASDAAGNRRTSQLSALSNASRRTQAVGLSAGLVIIAGLMIIMWRAKRRRG